MRDPSFLVRDSVRGNWLAVSREAFAKRHFQPVPISKVRAWVLTTFEWLEAARKEKHD